MSDFRRLSDTVWASPQISLDEVAEAKRAGFAAIINNRPDDEEAGQPTSAEIGAAAEALGLAYHYIPVTGSSMTPERIAETIAALEEVDGTTLAYCRSGTRSTLLWALAEARRGGDPEKLAQAASDAGYDLAPVRPVMDMLARQR